MTEHRRGPRGDISRDQLVAAAAGVLDAEGLHGLTQRSVARAAGVSPTVLYTYFTDMDELRHAVGDAFIQSWPLPLVRGEGSPRDRIRAFLEAALEACAQRPCQAELLATQAVVGPGSLALNEGLLQVLVDEAPQGTRMDPLAAHDLVGVLTAWFFGWLQSDLPSTSVAPDSPQVARMDFSSTPLSTRAWAQAAQRHVDDPHAGRGAALDLICSLVPEPTAAEPDPVRR